MIVAAYWAVVVLIGFLAFTVSLLVLLGLPFAMVGVAWLIGRVGEPRPQDREPVVRDEALW